MEKFKLENLGKTWCLRDLVEYIKVYSLILVDASNKTVRETPDDPKDVVSKDDLMELYSKVKALYNSVLDVENELDKAL